MAGGKGTRLTSVTNDLIPKPMVKISGKPILERQIDCLRENGLTDIWIVAGHLHEKIREYFGDGSGFGVTVHYYIEEQPLGTAGAFIYLKEYIRGSAIILFGDVLLDIDFRRFETFHKEKNAAITLFIHPNTHPKDSDLVLTDGKERVIGLLKKNEPRNGYNRNLVNAGVYCINFEKVKLPDKSAKMDLEKDVIIPRIQSEKDVYGYRSPEYIKDIGTPERLSEAEGDWSSGLIQQKNLRNVQKCVFLDRDGTLNKHVGLLTKVEELVLEETVPQALKLLHKKGYLAIVVTNQPVIARNLCTVEELEQIHAKLDDELGKFGTYVDDIRYCPHHPDRGYPEERQEYKIDCDCRKPKTGLIDYCIEKYHIDREKSYMIGDTTTDIRTGKNAGLRTILLKTGEAGNDGKYDDKPDQTVENLLDAAERVGD